MKKKYYSYNLYYISNIFIRCSIFYKDKKSDKTENFNKYSVIYDKEGNIIYDMSKEDETLQK